MINFFKKKTPPSPIENVFTRWVDDQSELTLEHIEERPPRFNYINVIINSRPIEIVITTNDYSHDEDYNITIFKFDDKFVWVSFRVFIGAIYLNEKTCKRVYDCFLEQYDTLVEEAFNKVHVTVIKKGCRND